MHRVVVDNCVPRTLLPHLAIPGATTVGDLGWADVDDGPLLELLAGVCDVFVTVDGNLQFQQLARWMRSFRRDLWREPCA